MEAGLRCTEWAEPLKELRRRHRGGGHTTEERLVESGVEAGWSDATERPAKTTKIGQKCETWLGRCWGVDTTRELGKNR